MSALPDLLLWLSHDLHDSRGPIPAAAASLVRPHNIRAASFKHYYARSCCHPRQRFARTSAARGDFRVLPERGGRALLAHIAGDVDAGIAALDKAARRALA
jgi:hypothetical protein